MKRPLAVFSIALIGGISTAAASNSYLYISLSILALVLSSAAVYFTKRKWIFAAFGVVLFFSVGALEFQYVNNVNLSKFTDFAGKEVAIRGIIDSEPNIKASTVSYVVKTREITSEGLKQQGKGKILFTTLTDSGQYLFDYGREVEIRGQLNLPKGRRNPGGFDYRRYLAQSGISATIFSRPENIKTGGMSKTNVLVRMGLRLKNRIVKVIDQSLPSQQAGLLNGMLIGYREGLSKEVEEAFSDAGLSHIMAVSGANVAFIILPFVLLFKKLKVNRKVANSIIIAILALFVFIVGFSPSVLRAVIMAVIILSGQMLQRETDVFTSIAFAAIVLLVFNPYSLFDIGFQLSFAATLSLVLFFKNIRQMLNFNHIPVFITDTLAVTLAAQVGVVPVVLYYFNKVSIISLVSNLVVVPVVEVITMLGAAMAILGQIHIVFAQIMGTVNCTFLSFVLYATKISSGLPFATIRVVTPPVLYILLYYFLAVFLLWYKPLVGFRLKTRHCTIAAGAILIAVCVAMMIPKKLEVIFIDVGQGDSALIRTSSGKTVLIDGGGHYSKTEEQPNIGETVVIPLLLDYGVSRLDLVVATHGHGDHIEGLIPVLESFEVKEFILPDTGENKELQKLVELAHSRAVKVEACSRGQRVTLDSKTYFDVVSPIKDMPQNKSPLNNSSLVLKLHYKNTRILFAGDMEEDMELQLLNGHMDLEADVLKVGHHGSDTSTGMEFLQQVKPAAAIISVGKNNFGHPSESVLKRLEENNVRIFRTDLDGAVILTTDGRQIGIKKTVKE